MDICIGINDDWSRPEDVMLERILDHFQRMGYRVVINEPYSNSVAPDCGILYRSLMIEVNKRTYMCGGMTLELLHAKRLRTALESFFVSLL